jgi:3-hydroxybutyryl-CoA dehydratase
MNFSQLRVGMTDSVAKTITETDVILFSAVSTDCNPLHINEEYAKNSMFKGRIAHGILVSGLISACIAAKLPGEGSIYLGQDLKFISPVRIGDTITARVEIIEIREDKKIVKLSTVCTNQNGVDVIIGTATVKKPE